jgi:hypothetical protein
MKSAMEPINSYIGYKLQKIVINFSWKNLNFEPNQKTMKPRIHFQPKTTLSHRLRQTVVLIIGGLLLLALVILSFLKQYQMEDNDPPIQQPVPVQPQPPQK